MAFYTTGLLTVQVISLSQQLKSSPFEFFYRRYNFVNELFCESFVEIVQLLAEI